MHNSFFALKGRRERSHNTESCNQLRNCKTDVIRKFPVLILLWRFIQLGQQIFPPTSSPRLESLDKPNDYFGFDNDSFSILSVVICSCFRKIQLRKKSLSFSQNLVSSHIGNNHRNCCPILTQYTASSLRNAELSQPDLI